MQTHSTNVEDAAYRKLPHTLAHFRDFRVLLAALLFTGLYIFTTLWFQNNDVYDTYFNQANPVYLQYHFFRFIAFLYFLWLLYFVGYLAMEAIQGAKASFELSFADFTIVAFFVGAAVVGLAVTALGFINLYYTSVALIGTAPLIFLSTPRLINCASKLRQVYEQSRQRPEFAIKIMLLVIVGLLCLAVFIDKVLFPASDGDVLVHYMPYFDQALRSHSLAPNEVWYQYFYSRGAGLMFLEMLLSDKRGLEVVSFCGALSVGAVAYALVKRATSRTIWALAAVIVYLSSLLHEEVGDTRDFASIVFGKQHIFMSALYAGIIFVIVLLPRLPSVSRPRWALVGALLTVHLAVFSPTGLPFILPFLVIYAVYYWLRKQRDFAWICGVVGGAGFIAFLGMLLLNYVLTGLAGFDVLRLTWAVADQAKFSQWVSPYLPVYFIEGQNTAMGTLTLTKDLPLTDLFYNLFHIQRIEPLLPGVLILGIILWLLFRRKSTDWKLTAGVWSILMPIIIVLLTSGIVSLAFNQPISLTRFFVFAIPLLLILVISAWGILLNLSFKPPLNETLLTIAPVILVLLAILSMQTLRSQQCCGIRQEIGFALGQMSFSEAYKVYGGLWPELVDAREKLGNDTRILAYNDSTSLGAVPGKPVESEVNFGYRDFHIMMFGSPSEAKAAYQKEGLNYFIFDTGMSFDYSPLAYSPLFAPNTLNDWFDVVLHEGKTYLLTWKGGGDGRESISQETIDSLSRKIPLSLPDLFARVKLYYDRNKGAAYPVYSDPSLPPVQGWQ